ncbi:MAG: zf-TFIIB domain-containing protein [bacterium]|nr:zf-TFIIB domain-containing protein [bacterium]
MDCPICKRTLQLADRQGVEIDYCPQCRGIWLDRGELDKLMELAAESSARRIESSRTPLRQPNDHHQQVEHRTSKGYKKRESWLSQILDFD